MFKTKYTTPFVVLENTIPPPSEKYLKFHIYLETNELVKINI